MPNERQLTTGDGSDGGRILTNVNVWSPDGLWILYDTRSDASGEKFDGTRIEAIHVETREVRVLYESRNGACCGVATWHPFEQRIIFIHGPEHPTADWSYGPSRRHGVIVEFGKPTAIPFDGRDLVPPFTPGALRGGSHVHVFSPCGQKVSFTYEDEFLRKYATETPEHEMNLRSVGIGVPAGLIKVGKGHPRNQDGTYFCVLVTRTTANPKPGSDEIKKAFEEGWVGSNALAFQGHVVTEHGDTIAEVFITRFPDDIRKIGTGPLQGSQTRRPTPPHGTTQRRLTFTAKRKYPGLQGPRHWLRSSPDQTKIAFLMKDDAGLPQLWSVSPNGGEPQQLSRTETGVASAFTWNRDGSQIAFVCDQRIATIDVRSGNLRFLTEPGRPTHEAPRPEACVFSPDGRQIAFVRRIRTNGRETNQIFCVDTE